MSATMGKEWIGDSDANTEACDKWTACQNYMAHDLECDCANTGVATINGEESPYSVPE